MDIKIQRRIGLVIGLLVIGFLVGAWLLSEVPTRREIDEEKFREILETKPIVAPNNWPEYKDGKG